MAKLVFSGGNEAHLLHTGEQYFASLITAIDAAETEIYLETYIFANDACANHIQACLSAAAKRGVQVQVMIDWVGCGDAYASQLQSEFQRDGVECRIFNPWFKRGLVRSHRKLCVIDQRIAYVGGINIIDDRLPDNDEAQELPFPRWDFAVQLQGHLVSLIHKEVAAQWLKLGRFKLLQRLRLARELRKPPSTADDRHCLAALVIRDNLRNRSTIQKAYLLALGHAKQSAILANPYFAPDRKIRTALISAANRGVDVSLLLGVGEFDWQDAVAQSYYQKLLENGVKIYEYRKTKLHAKVAVIDQVWATVGSCNFDGFSLFVNHEANVVIRDRTFAHSLSTYLKQGLLDAVHIDVNTLVKQSSLRHLRNRLAYLFYRMILRVATLGEYR